jgi:hypothetical protein
MTFFYTAKDGFRESYRDTYFPHDYQYKHETVYDNQMEEW